MTSKHKGIRAGNLPVYAARMRGHVIPGLFIVNGYLYLGTKDPMAKYRNTGLPGIVLKEPHLWNRIVVRFKIYWARLTCW